MGCLVIASRVSIVIFNILFIIIGLVFFALGLLIKLGSNLYKSALYSVDRSVDWESLTDPISLTFIGLGLFILVICFLGCCGAGFNFRVLLILYIVPAIIILVAEIVVVIIFLCFPSVIQTPIASSLKTGIQSDFEDVSGTNLASQAWSFVMQQVKCCGANDYRDFTGASKWSTTKYTSTCGGCTLVTPLACCKTQPTAYTASDLTCATSPTTDNNYLNTGCVSKVWNDYILANKASIGGAIAGLAVFQAILIILAFVIFFGTKKENLDEGPINKNKVAPMKTAFKNNGRPPIGQKNNKVQPARY